MSFIISRWGILASINKPPRLPFRIVIVVRSTPYGIRIALGSIPRPTKYRSPTKGGEIPSYPARSGIRVILLPNTNCKLNSELGGYIVRFPNSRQQNSRQQQTKKNRCKIGSRPKVWSTLHGFGTFFLPSLSSIGSECFSSE